MPQRFAEAAMADRDLAACRQLLRSGSRSFHVASLLLPAAVHEPATALYAFCRVADDAIDGEAGAAGAAPDAAARSAALAMLNGRLVACYEGVPADNPVDRAFAAVVSRHAIPRALPEALLEGFAWDAEARRYEDLAQLRAYAVRVAGSVGIMMSLLMGERSARVLARACDLGVAMQLTNIARDVGDDARAGRLYLPTNWLREAGIDAEAWLARPVFDAALASVVQRLLDAAAALYERSASGIAWLPLSCRPGMHAARLIYADIGRSLQRAGLDSVHQRARVGDARKLALALTSVLVAARPRAQLSAAALEESQSLLDAVGSRAPAAAEVTRIGWLLELFERLERDSSLPRERA
jgi:15-cis-phytoene synthase